MKEEITNQRERSSAQPAPSNESWQQQLLDELGHFPNEDFTMVEAFISKQISEAYARGIVEGIENEASIHHGEQCRFHKATLCDCYQEQSQSSVTPYQYPEGYDCDCGLCNFCNGSPRKSYKKDVAFVKHLTAKMPEWFYVIDDYEKELVKQLEGTKQKGRHKGDCLCKTCHMIEGYNQALFEAIQTIKKQDES